MATQQSPHSISETASCSSPGLPIETRKRKHSTTGSQPAREYGLMRDTGEHDAARFVGSGSGIHYIRAVHLRLARRSASRTAESSILNTLIPGEDDQLHQRSSAGKDRNRFLWKAIEVTDELNDSVLTFEDFTQWSKSYFESWHPVLPFLHGPEVLQIFEDASRCGVASLNSMDRVVLKSILSISLADSRQGVPFQKPIPKQLLFESVDDAVANSQFALSQPASIRSTQAALAIQLFLISMLCLNAASRLGGLIVRMAFHMGLHRCPTRFPFFTAKEASIRRRVFWSMYSLERLLCQSLGLPLDIRDDDLDVCYPGEEKHVSARTDEDMGNLQLLTFVAKHARIRGLILELRNKSMVQRQDTVDQTAMVQTELAKWSNEIQDAVEADDTTDQVSDVLASTSKISPTHSLMLLILKHESAICLNRPGLASQYPSSSYSSAFQACISAARSIFILLKKHRNRYRLENNLNIPRLQKPLLWPSFTWAAWISAFVLIHAAFEDQAPLDSVLRHVISGKDALSHLAARQTSWPEYCSEAIDELISAVQELSPSHARAPALESPIDDSVTARVLSRNPAARTQTIDLNLPIGGREASPDSREGEATDIPNAGSHAPAKNSCPHLKQTLPHDVLSQPNQPKTAPRTGILPSHATWEQRVSEPHVPLNPTANHRPDSLRGSNVPCITVLPEGPTTLSQPEAHTGPCPDSITVEGQESLMWYDQLFASSFCAIDNPFLAAAEFDASIDPTWNYLR